MENLIASGYYHVRAHTFHGAYAICPIHTLEPPMQMIEAVIKPHKLDAVKGALAKLGILGVTAVECKGFGRQMGHTERYRGAKMDVGFVPKVLLKICVKSEEAQQAVAAIVESARTGEVGDGKIFVYPVAQVVRI